MCTVTFIPAADRIFITHNRDEKQVRSKAAPPQLYTINGHSLLFPKDTQAGGSWIAMNEYGHAAVLLNGAFEKHTWAGPYRQSRGLCFLEIAAAEDMGEAYRQVDLENIEPFTVILYDQASLAECRWDGKQKHIRPLNVEETHIWSSATLYDKEIADRRAGWFTEWLNINKRPLAKEIIDFHLSGGDGDPQHALRMQRDGTLLTVSVTAMELSASAGRLRYIDLQDNTTYHQTLTFITSPERVER